MRVNVETLNSTERKLDVWIPAENVKEKIEEVFREFHKNANVKGFRQGKVPRRVIESIYGSSIMGEAAQKLVSGSIDQALAEASVQPVSRPDVDPEDISEGKEFHYTARFEVLPGFDLSSYTGIPIKRERAEVTDSDIERILEHLQNRGAQAKALTRDRKVRNGDFVIVDYEGVLEGEILPELKKSGVQLVVGEGQIVEEFEDNLLGMKKGGEKEFEVTYKDDFIIPKAAGRTVKFKLELKDVMERIVPDLDDEFAKDHGEETLDGLKKAIRAEREGSLGRAAEEKAKSDIVDHLIEKNSFDVPRSLLGREVGKLREGLTQQYSRMSMDIPDWNEGLEGRLRQRAEKNIKASIILGEISRREGIEVSEKELEARLRELSRGANVPYEQLKDAYMQGDMLERLRDRMIEEKVLEFLVEKSEIEDVLAENDQIDKEK
ncbi:MAG: trigger factor [Thermodesulfobacteriota bacterium]